MGRVEVVGVPGSQAFPNSITMDPVGTELFTKQRCEGHKPFQVVSTLPVPILLLPVQRKRWRRK